MILGIVPSETCLPDLRDAMSNDLLPESIRGGWYWMPRDYEEGDVDDEDVELALFRLDETFERGRLEDDTWETSDGGEFTFDGKFLIVRGGRTRTFRVHPRHAWHWYLEGKKDDHHLLRGRTGPHTEPKLSRDRQQAIERLPMQVLVRSRADLKNRGEFADLVHEPRDGETRVIAHLYAEVPQNGRLWLALTPLASGLDVDTWMTIVRQSYLDVHLDAPDSIEHVDVACPERDALATLRYQG